MCLHLYSNYDSQCLPLPLATFHLYAVTLQVDVALPNFLIQESFYDCFPRWKKQLVKDEWRVENGHSKVSAKPGLGVEIDEKVLEEHRAEGQEYFNPNEPVWVVKDTWKD